uniref:Uncharacterized protein n=1 Tax=Cryptomonas curvata TaxID=233186 RepID=A0A7S0LV28_9CRYP|mmetsp:Transcript_11861/g.25467  ORF Transcript_11861/g.25467 Transcript_11861/m.25467 type:complete len:157 (+) Transcript_11861:79-549(+)
MEGMDLSNVLRPTIQTDHYISDLLCLRFDNSCQFEHVGSSNRAMEARSESESAIQSDFGDVSLDADFRDITEHFPSSACTNCDSSATRINCRGLFIEERHNSRVEVDDDVFESKSHLLESSPNAIFFFELPALPDPADCCNGHFFKDNQPDFDELN